MLPMHTSRVKSLAAGCLALAFLMACASHAAGPAPTATERGLLTPFKTSTPTRTPAASRSPDPSQLAAVERSPTPTATPTPFLHVLTNDDTLFGLALKYGVSLEAIETANPDVKPNYLTVGKSIVIPIKPTAGTPTIVPTPTPIPVTAGAAQCYATADGGAWCFLRVQNSQPQALENLSARISLLEGGQTLAEQVAISPLNLLPPGQSIPLVTFFPPPVPAGVAANAELLTALTVPVSDTRYLTATAQVDRADIAADGLQAAVRGRVLLTGNRAPSLVWVAVVAYDADGNVAGVRRWEANPEALKKLCEGNDPSQSCASLPFEETVYSLGPVIGRVEALVEARP